MAARLRRAALGWLSLLLLPLPAVVGYAESRVPLGAPTEISNRSAKGDRLPLARQTESAWRSCASTGRGDHVAICRVLGAAD